MQLAEQGILERYNVQLLGTPLEAIRHAEDRELFRQLLLDIGEPTPPSATVTSIAEAYEVKSRLGLPLVIRPAYTLGGTGGGVVRTEEEFEESVRAGIAASPINQVLLERSLEGWKEIEYEVMRDANDTCITVCNMENLDPMGVHTGDSIVVAPSQTLNDKEYQLLRSASPQDHPRAGHRGRLQRAARAGAASAGRRLPAGGRALRVTTWNTTSSR